VPPLLAYLGRHCLVGIAAGWVLLAALVATDVGSLKTLLAGSSHWPEALALLMVFFAITFGSLAMGTAVMMLGHTTANGRRRKLRPSRPRVPVLPAPVSANSGERRH